MRTFDRVAAVLLAFVGLVGGVLLAIECVHTALGGSGHLVVGYEPVADFFRTNTWSTAVIVTIGVLLALVGLVLLVAELKPRRPALLVLESTDGDVTAALPRRGVGRVLQSAAAGVDGVDGSTAKVRGRKVVLTAHTPLRDPGDLRTSVTRQAQAALDGLHLRRAPSLTVRVRQQEESS